MIHTQMPNNVLWACCYCERPKMGFKYETTVCGFTEEYLILFFSILTLLSTARLTEFKYVLYKQEIAWWACVLA